MVWHSCVTSSHWVVKGGKPKGAANGATMPKTQRNNTMIITSFETASRYNFVQGGKKCPIFLHQQAELGAWKADGAFCVFTRDGMIEHDQEFGIAEVQRFENQEALVGELFEFVNQLAPDFSESWSDKGVEFTRRQFLGGIIETIHFYGGRSAMVGSYAKKTSLHTVEGYNAARVFLKYFTPLNGTKYACQKEQLEIAAYWLTLPKPRQEKFFTPLGMTEYSCVHAYHEALLGFKAVAQPSQRKAGTEDVKALVRQGLITNRSYNTVANGYIRKYDPTNSKFNQWTTATDKVEMMVKPVKGDAYFAVSGAIFLRGTQA